MVPIARTRANRESGPLRASRAGGPTQPAGSSGGRAPDWDTSREVAALGILGLISQGKACGGGGNSER